MVPLIRKCARFALRTASGRLVNSPSILRRIFPAPRFRTYDPVIGNDSFLNSASTGDINAKNPPQRAGFWHWCR